MSNLELEKMYQGVKKTIVAGCFVVIAALFNHGLNIESPTFAAYSVFIVSGIAFFVILIWIAEIWDYGRTSARAPTMISAYA
jgi:uncharacterized membrane protein YdcZ (DUF606 family)